MSRTIAIAHPSTPNEVRLWCSNVRRYTNGTISFWVINGGWNGRLKPDGSIHVRDDGWGAPKADEAVGLGVVVWEGEAPFSYNSYNDAITWIETQLQQNSPSLKVNPLSHVHMEDKMHALELVVAYLLESKDPKAKALLKVLEDETR